MQYTIRAVPGSLDAELRRRAKEEGKSLNQVLIEALARGAGLTRERARYRELTDLSGSWKEDPEFDAAIADQRKIDDELWE